MAHQSVLPYLSYPASLLRSRLSAIENVGSTFTFEFDFEGGGEAKSLKRGGALAEFYRTESVSPSEDKTATEKHTDCFGVPLAIMSSC
jgi:hypothetical protein